jgi:antitoxin YefM
MNSITAQQAEATFNELLQQILQKLEPITIITADGESVVMLPLQEYQGWQETLYLLSSPANAAHLAQSIAEDQAGYRTIRPLLEP